LPEVTDQTKWYLKKHQYSDPEGQHVFNYVGSATYGSIHYNTKLVDLKEFKSYWDLLNPKWRGKITIRDIREAGPGAGNTRFFYYHGDLGPAFIKKLFGEMDATLFRDFRQGPDWLATGKYAICFFCDADTLKQQGLPVDTFGPRVFKEGGGLVLAIRHRCGAQSCAASKCREGIHQLAAVAQWANRASETYHERREPGGFPAHRYCQGRSATARTAPRWH
jgi:hypothetical protein